ncbi:hypothetical protein ACTXOJ_17020 [Glutamicibacter arilaitensis]|uniref:hypothetical protein n=1 Tax=Glutamicibacter arilaitensis TaxID=256701 RepID=UPI003FD4193F
MDISSHQMGGPDAELLVTGTRADEPIGLTGASADLYRSLVQGPVAESSLTDAEVKLLQNFSHFGLASTEPESVYRIRSLASPWFDSPVHELVCALVASIAKRDNFEVIFIKGPSLFKQGIREKRHSGDVDVLVAPHNFERVIEALEEFGWERQVAFWDGTGINHSTALSAPANWGCEVDIHEYFPGIGLPADQAFRVLMESTYRETFAGIPSFVPNIEAHSVLYALHQIRPEFGIVRSGDLHTVAARAFSIAGDESYTIAKDLKADAVLGPLFQQAFPDLEISQTSDIPFNWMWRSQDSRVAGYLYALRSLPRMTRLRILVQLIWPREDLVWQSDKLAKNRSKTLAQARLARYRRGIKNCIGIRQCNNSY